MADSNNNLQTILSDLYISSLQPFPMRTWLRNNSKTSTSTNKSNDNFCRKLCFSSCVRSLYLEQSSLREFLIIPLFVHNVIQRCMEVKFLFIPTTMNGRADSKLDADALVSGFEMATFFIASFYS